MDRVPAWIAWATVDQLRMGAHYDGIYWHPPLNDRHRWYIFDTHHEAAAASQHQNSAAILLQFNDCDECKLNITWFLISSP